MEITAITTDVDPRAAAFGHRREVAGICALLGILVVLVFGQTVNHGFANYDDTLYVSSNPMVSKGITVEGIDWAFSHKELGLWNPLVTISHMLDCQLYGGWAGGHHLSNVLLHLASVLLLFLILRQMTGALWCSAFVAALFAIHPLRVESVAWIAERKDVLSGFFFMLTLGAYLHYVRRPDCRGRYWTVILLFALGLMCKPMLVTLPFVLLLLDYWPLNRLFLSVPSGSDPAKKIAVNWRAVAEKIPFMALSFGLCVATMLGPKETVSIEHVPFWTRIGEAPVWLVVYLGQMIWPSGLAVIYTHPEASLPWWPAAVALLGFLSIGIFLLRRKHPYLWMGWLWNLGMLVPVIGIVQISHHARADHYNYLPQIGLCIAVTWTLACWAGERRHRCVVLGGMGAMALFALLVVASKQTSYWRDNETLWRHTLGCTHDNALAHNNLGLALLDQERTEEAIVQYREALRINPEYALAHNNLGAALVKQERTKEAIVQYHEALRINPDYASAHNNLGAALVQQGRTKEAFVQYHEALRINPDYADAHYNLGAALIRQGRTKEALAQYREALRINPAFAEARNNLGAALFQQGHIKEALAQYREALRINPAFAGAHYNLGDALAQQGRADEAIAQYREALRINPAFAEAHNNLGDTLIREGRTEEGIAQAGEALRLQPANAAFQNNLAWVLVTAPQISLRNGARAVQLATQACQSTGGNNLHFLYTLAEAYAEAGEFPKAVQTAQNALKLAENQSNTQFATALRRKIKLYETGHRLEEVR